jgi:outer membrane beta-barrel protein
LRLRIHPHSTARLLAGCLLAAAAGLGGCSLRPSHSEPSTSGDAGASAAVDTRSDQDKIADGIVQRPIVDPNIERRKITVPRIRSSNIETGLFAGVLNTQDLQSSLIYGARAAYHVTEDFFLEAEYARSTVSDKVRREIGQPFFPQENMDLSTYGVDLGYNVLPGEVFFGTRRAMTSTIYLIGGVGNTSFNSEDYLTYSAGFGIKVLPTDWLSIRLEARDRIWQSDLLGSKELTNNLETTLGVAAYF